jgi:hypothetical protein
MAERSKCRRTKERRIGHIIDKVQFLLMIKIFIGDIMA